MTPASNAKPSSQTAKTAAPSHRIDNKAPQLRLERVFDATPDRLWSHWTDPKKYAKWLSPQKADLVIHEWDLRVGGKVRFDMPLDNGTVNKEEGVFHVLDKPRHLVSGNADKTFLIDATFTPVDGGKRTKLTVLVTGVPAEYHAMATEGWGQGFAKLDRLLAKGA
ncbi:MAG: SRPBCC domain-containing protein [Candidatus Thermoplasmatota archaeon]